MLIVAALFLAIPFLPGVIIKTSPKVWIFAGILVLLGLMPPTHLLMGPLPGAPPFQTILMYLIAFMPTAAVVVGALLLYAGLTCRAQGQLDPNRGSTRLTALIFLVLALLMTRLLDNIYWLMVWDSTDDELGYIWLALPLLASLFSGILLLHLYPKKNRRVALYGLLIPALLIAVSAGAMQTSFRQRTVQRAARISQAVEAYAQREGHYPQRLSELVPRYLLALPGPVIIYQQDWCYEAGPGFYRLAYVDREHWSSPELFAHVYRTKGEIPALPPVCDSEIQALIQTYPRYYTRIADR